MLLFWILLFSLLAGLGGISLAGAVLLFKESTRRSVVPLLVSYAVGALVGAALLAILPEVLEEIPTRSAFATVIAGILAFFALEKIILLHHCHDTHCTHHVASGMLILIGDGVHNFVDGIAIAAAFLTSVPLGIATGLAAISHEIPQEVGDFGILLNAGFERGRAFFLNGISAIMTIPGALLGYFLLGRIEQTVPYFLAIAAASFLYIGMADLVPHLHEHIDRRTGVYQFLLILAGVATIFLVETLIHGG